MGITMENEQIKAYKLVRLKKNGQITPLHINRKMELPLGEWLTAGCHPRKGFAVRQGFHAAAVPFVPHMDENVKFEKRVWVEVTLEDVSIKKVPECQGGKWYLAQRCKHNRILDMDEVITIRKEKGITK